MAVVRSERPGDEEIIHTVHAACFPTEDEARLVDLLRNAGRLTISLVAEMDEAIVGHVAFSPVTSATSALGAGLAPLAVLQPQRRRGIAAELVRKGLEACRAAGVGWVVVLGEPEYYSRFGFRAASEFGLQDEYSGGSAFQAIELIPGKLPKGTGLVRYAPDFATLVEE